MKIHKNTIKKGVESEILGSFFVGRILGIYTHSMSEESKYPFYLRNTLAANQPSCSDYKSITESDKTFEVKVIESNPGENAIMMITAEETDSGVRFFVSIMNHQHEQYFDEILLDCPQ